MKKILLLILLIFIFFITACNNKADQLQIQLNETGNQLIELKNSTDAEIMAHKKTIEEMDLEIEKYSADINNLNKAIIKYNEQSIKIENLEAIIKELEIRNVSLQNELMKSNSPILRIFLSDNDGLSFGYMSTDKYTFQIIIVNDNRSYIDTEPSDIYIESHNSDTQLVISVVGKIFNFKFLNVTWDEQAGHFIDQDIIESFDEIQDSNIHILTYLPEGMPAQKIQWENETGEITEWYVADNGLGIRGEIILIF